MPRYSPVVLNDSMLLISAISAPDGAPETGTPLTAKSAFENEASSTSMTFPSGGSSTAYLTMKSFALPAPKGASTSGQGSSFGMLDAMRITFSTPKSCLRLEEGWGLHGGSIGMPLDS